MGLIADLKSTTNADPDKWIKTSINADVNPYLQAAHYLQGAQLVLGPQFKTFLWILMEIKEPFGISVLQAAPTPDGKTDYVFLANRILDNILSAYLESEKYNHFPGYDDKVVFANPPEWWIKQLGNNRYYS